MTLTFRQSSMSDLALRRALIDLTQTVFGVSLQPLSDLGAWSPGYRAFSWFEGERMVANVSIRPLELRIEGRQRAFMQVHAVSTLPEWRRRGLFGDLMARALEWADRQAEGVFLFTGVPETYARFGFRVVEENRFAGRLAGPVAVESRLLDLRGVEDVVLIHRLAAGRAAVSEVVGVLGNGDVLLWNLWHQPGWQLTYLPGRDALVVHDSARLIDVVAAQMPPEGEIAGVMRLAEGQEVEVLFPPDRLAGAWTRHPHKGEDGDGLMVRGVWAAAPAMLPLTALG